MGDYYCLDDNQNISWTQANRWETSYFSLSYEFPECFYDTESQSCLDVRYELGSEMTIEYAYSY